MTVVRVSIGGQTFYPTPVALSVGCVVRERARARASSSVTFSLRMHELSRRQEKRRAVALAVYRRHMRRVQRSQMTLDEVLLESGFVPKRRRKRGARKATGLRGASLRRKVRRVVENISRAFDAGQRPVSPTAMQAWRAQAEAEMQALAQKHGWRLIYPSADRGAE